MNVETIRSCVAGGKSVLVGSVDSGGMPACCRGVALTATDDLASCPEIQIVSTGRGRFSLRITRTLDLVEK